MAPKLVLRLPESLMEKVSDAAEADDMLPTEWVREVVRDAVDEMAESEPPEDEDREAD